MYFRYLQPCPSERVMKVWVSLPSTECIAPSAAVWSRSQGSGCGLQSSRGSGGGQDWTWPHLQLDWAGKRLQQLGARNSVLLLFRLQYEAHGSNPLDFNTYIKRRHVSRIGNRSLPCIKIHLHTPQIIKWYLTRISIGVLYRGAEYLFQDCPDGCPQCGLFSGVMLNLAVPAPLKSS